MSAIVRDPEQLHPRARNALYRYWPRAARLLVSASTLGAQLRMYQEPPLRILVDSTVLFHAITHESAWVSTGTKKWGPNDLETGYSARIPVRSLEDESRELRSIKFLPGIAHLAKLGKLSLMSSGELWTERFLQPVGRFNGYGYFDLNVFEDVELPLVDNIPDMVSGPSSWGLPNLEEQRAKRLAESTDPLFRSLVTQLGPRNSQDAWHIRTAEVNEMFCFLTMDFKLLRSLQARSTAEPLRTLKTRILTPEQLGEHLRLVPVNPTILSFEKASSPIRPDLHWPDSKRQKPVKIKSR